VPPAARRPSRSSGPPGLGWEDAAPAPVVLVLGPEELLAGRAVARIVERAGVPEQGEDRARLERVDADEYTPGTLQVLASPSLFADDKVVVVTGLERAADEVLADVAAYVATPLTEAVVVLCHGGGQRGKALLDAVRATGAPVVVCEPLRSDSDKLAFASAEVRRAGRRIDNDALRALVDAVGSDLRELAAACAQLVADTAGVIGPEAVRRYYGGRVEATGFQVADAAVAGRAGEAVSLLRHALATGVDPVPLVAALAVRLRVLAKVGAARGRGAGAAADLGLAPWQVDRALRELRGWTPEGLAAAISAVAQADADVKGEGRDPRYAVERAVLAIAAASGR